MNNASLINQTSGNVEWYTPVEIVQAARRVMGGIDYGPLGDVDAQRLDDAERVLSQALDAPTTSKEKR